MERWKNKVAVVTGASSGIGAAIAVKLAQNGITVLGLARRVERIQELAEKCKKEKGCIIPRKADITKEEELLAALKYADKFMGGIDILVNNAGMTVKTNILDGDTDAWRRMFELNVMTLSITTRELVKSVKKRSLTDGYIINISSVAAHRLPQRTANIVYAASKAAAKIITEGARMELAAMKSEIKITNLSPGVVRTEIFEGGGWGEEFSNQPQLEAEDIADAVMYLLENPLYVQIPELTIRKNGETW